MSLLLQINTPAWQYNAENQQQTLFTLVDTSGSYTNNGTGYGSPNVAASAITSATTQGSLYLPNNTIVTIPLTTIFPTTPNPLPYVVGETYSLSPAQIGLTYNTYPDGIYSITYSVYDDATIEGTVTTQFPFDQNSWCCINGKFSNLSTCGCNDTELCELRRMYDYLKGFEQATACNKMGQALQMLSVVQSYCNNNGCGCS